MPTVVAHFLLVFVVVFIINHLIIDVFSQEYMAYFLKDAVGDFKIFGKSVTQTHTHTNTHTHTHTQSNSP